MIGIPAFAFEAESKPASSADAAPACAGAPLGDLSNALRAAGLFDITAVDVPGSYAVQPDGMKLVRRFRALVRAAYEGAGLLEHEYPDVVPRAALAPLRAAIGERAVPLGLTGRDEDLVLAPTGEALFYRHWARAFKRREDYPVRAFRCGTYFRPVRRGHHAGRSIFRNLESHDVFEFHVADAGELEHAETLRRMHGVLAQLVAELRLPVLHGVRPPWTNNGELYRWALAGDAVLPGGSTVQLTTLYDQGDELAERFGIRILDGPRRAPLIASGAITRRSLFVHLLIGLTDRTRFVIHPHLAPADVVVLALDAAVAAAIAAPLRLHAARVATEVAPSARELFRLQERRYRQGVPVTVAAPERSGAGARLVVRRTDATGETKLRGTDELAALAGEALRAIGAAYDARAAAVYDHGLGNARCGCAPAIERVPLAAAEEIVRAFEARRHGEVLSFARCAPAACSVSGGPTALLAAHGRRV